MLSQCDPKVPATTQNQRPHDHVQCHLGCDHPLSIKETRGSRVINLTRSLGEHPIEVMKQMFYAGYHMVTTMARVRAENAFSCIKFLSQATARPPMTTCITGALEKILTLENSGLKEGKKWIIEGRRMKGGRLTHESKLAAILFDTTMSSGVNFYPAIFTYSCPTDRKAM